MRQRVGRDAAAVPPAELVDYPLWCRSRGLRPYGDPAAVSQWALWEQLRMEWCQAHGVDEGDLGGTDSAPFDIDAI